MGCLFFAVFQTRNNAVDAGKKSIDNLGDEFVFGRERAKGGDFFFGEVGTFAVEATLELNHRVSFGEFDKNFCCVKIFVATNCVKELANETVGVGVFVGSNFFHCNFDKAVFHDLDFDARLASELAEFLELSNGEALIFGEGDHF